MWHAFNWNGEHAQAETKRDLLDSLAIEYGIEYKRLGGSCEVRRCCAGTYELSNNDHFFWHIYNSLGSAQADGYTTENYGEFTEITFGWQTRIEPTIQVRV